GDADLFSETYGDPSPDKVIQFLVFDYGNPNSVYSCLRSARENARAVREIISSEAWEQINGFYLEINDAARAGRRLEHPSEFFHRIRLNGQTVTGVIDATMSHDEPWHFCRLGRLLERGEQTARLLDAKYFLLLPSSEYVGSTIDGIQWSAVLRSASGFEMYRKRYGRIEPSQIIRFLLLNRDFPRATYYCVVEADDSLHAICGTQIGEFSTSAERELGRLRWEFAFSEADDIIASGMHEYLDALQTKFNRVGSGIRECFFGVPPTVGQNQSGSSSNA
ncbi:MAG: alpha-E domain-containing protein, partial [Alkalispirochaetaceae bacterium]